MTRLKILSGLVAGVALTASSHAFGGVLNLSTGSQYGDYGWVITFPDSTPENPSTIDLSYVGLGSDGTIILEKYADFVGSMAALTLNFTRTHASSFTHFAFEDETIINDSGAPWTQFTFGVNGAATFDTTGTVAVPRDVGFFSAPFTTPVITPDHQLIVATGGVLQSGGFPANVWGPGVDPDTRLYFTSASTFALREGPVVPEPVSVGLLTPAALLVVRRRR